MENQNQENSRTLSHLNTVLFDALTEVIEGTMEKEKAQVISNLGGQIINNAKTQLSYYKLTSNKKALTAFEAPQAPLVIRPAQDIRQIPVTVEDISFKKQDPPQEPVAKEAPKKEHEPFVETPEQIAYAKHKKYLDVVEGLVVEGQDTFKKNAAEWAEANMQPVES